jgi:phage baseplate assembly protein gpV
MIEHLSNAIKNQINGMNRSNGEAKFATISSVNFQTGNVRVIVQPDGVLSGWLPVLSPWVGNGWGMACPPSTGDQVLLIAHEGDVEQGVVVGRAFSQQAPPPQAPEGEMWLVHKSGSFLKLCSDGTIQIAGDLKVNGNIYDSHGSMASLREHYDSHTHIDSRAVATSPPNLID